MEELIRMRLAAANQLWLRLLSQEEPGIASRLSATYNPGIFLFWPHDVVHAMRVTNVVFQFE